MEQTDKKISKMKLIGMVGTLLFLVVLVLGFTYAVYSFNKVGDVENQITTGTLLLTVDDSKDLSLSGVSPMDDSDAMATEAYTFTVTNGGSLSAKYQLRFVKDEADYPGGSSANFTTNHIKYGVKIGSADATVRYMNDDDGLIVSDRTLASGASESYSIWLWIDNTTDIPTENFDTGTIQFHGHVQLDAVQDEKSSGGGYEPEPSPGPPAVVV